MILINVTNHKLTTTQVKGFTGVIEMPEELKTIWSQVSPDSNGDQEAKKVMAWVNSLKSPHALVAIQGHFGATFALVKKIRTGSKHTPVFASSIRNSVEVEENGIVVKKTVFVHHKWIKYA